MKEKRQKTEGSFGFWVLSFGVKILEIRQDYLELCTKLATTLPQYTYLNTQDFRGWRLDVRKDPTSNT